MVSSLRILSRAYAAVSAAGISSFVVASTKAEKSAAMTITAKSLKDHSHSVADALIFCGYMNCLFKLYLPFQWSYLPENCLKNRQANCLLPFGTILPSWKQLGLFPPCSEYTHILRCFAVCR